MYFLHSIYICSLEYLSLLHVFIYSFIYINMDTWTYYSVGYNLVPSLFILWPKLFWLLGIPSSWFPMSLWRIPSFFAHFLYHKLVHIYCPGLELITHSRSPSFLIREWYLEIKIWALRVLIAMATVPRSFQQRHVLTY